MKTHSYFLALALFVTPLSAQDQPDREEVVSSMRRAVSFLRTNLSVAGGYASEWPKDLSEGRTEGHSSPTVISIQPPGTTTIGLAMLRAYEATGDAMLLRGTLEAADALLWCQLSSGGWDDDYDFNPKVASKYHYRRDVVAGDAEPEKRDRTSTLDDNKTQSALLFLLELSRSDAGRGDKDLSTALEFAWDGLFAAQFPNGAWPQQYSGPAPADLEVKKASFPEEWPREWPKEKYTGFYTLNDGNLEMLMSLLLRAHELTSEERFLSSAKRLGDFLLLAQFEGDQPAWAQQYDTNMQPVWARKFEPPAVSSTESLSTIEALFELWVATGEEKYRETLPRALDWLEKSRLPNGKWARFYELTTNKPLYCEAETYKLTYDDSNLPTHYGFQVDWSETKISRMREELARPHEEAVKRFSGERSAESWAKKARELSGKVKGALESQHERGFWLDGETIDGSLFVKHLQTMAEYITALDKGGEIKSPE